MTHEEKKQRPNEKGRECDSAVIHLRRQNNIVKKECKKNLCRWVRLCTIEVNAKVLVAARQM